MPRTHKDLAAELEKKARERTSRHVARVKKRGFRPGFRPSGHSTKVMTPFGPVTLTEAKSETDVTGKPVLLVSTNQNDYLGTKLRPTKAKTARSRAAAAKASSPFKPRGKLGATPDWKQYAVVNKYLTPEPAYAAATELRLWANEGPGRRNRTIKPPPASLGKGVVQPKTPFAENATAPRAEYVARFDDFQRRAAASYYAIHFAEDQRTMLGKEFRGHLDKVALGEPPDAHFGGSGSFVQGRRPRGMDQHRQVEAGKKALPADTARVRADTSYSSDDEDKPRAAVAKRGTQRPSSGMKRAATKTLKGRSAKRMRPNSDDD